MSDFRTLPDAERYRTLPNAALEDAFVLRSMFRPGAITLAHVDLDRVVLGGAVPGAAPLRLEPQASMRSEYFLERREAGILNVGDEGTVSVDGKQHRMANRDVLYVGRGSREVTFASADKTTPAAFYIVSYPAQVTHPTTHLSRERADVTELGDAAHANRRRLVKYIHTGGIQSAQLVLGVTELLPGNVWNTMPPHTHTRRTEVYLYFDLPADAAVFHVMGEPQNVRTLLVHDREAALSPGWSIHAGCGTSNYSFCWAMGGENQDYTDMQPVSIGDLR